MNFRTFVSATWISILFLTWGPGQAIASPADRQASGAGGPELFTLDASHSEASFAVRHLGLSRVRGTFSQLSGSLLYDSADPTASSVTVVIRTASLFTGNERRDDDLKENFFETERYPEIVFQSTRVERRGEDLTLVGALRIKDVTREVEIPVAFLGEVVNEQNGNRIVGFEGELRIDRRDWNVAREGHPAEIARTIGHEVTIDLQVEAVRQDFAAVPFQGGDRPSVGQVLWEVIEAGGIDAAEARLHEIRGGAGDGYNLGPREFGVLGMRLLQEGRAGEAARILRLAAQVHPEVAVVQEWLGHALAQTGPVPEAVESYASTLRLAPRNTAAIEMIRFLTDSRDRMTVR